MNGEVDSQLLNRIFLGANQKIGINFIAQSIGEQQIPFHDKKRRPKELDFECGKFGKRLSVPALVHAVQVIYYF